MTDRLNQSFLGLTGEAAMSSKALAISRGCITDTAIGARYQLGEFSGRAGGLVFAGGTSVTVLICYQRLHSFCTVIILVASKDLLKARRSGSGREGD